MSTRALATGLYRTALILVAFFTAAAVKPLRAQEASGFTRALPAHAPSFTSPNTTLGPRLTPRFESFTPVLARSEASTSSSAAAVSGGEHTIVFSTLALVLGVIILVLLVVR
jgi:hypothetical protein